MSRERPQIEIEGQRKKWRPKRMCKKQVKEESVKVYCTLLIKVKCWY